MIIATDMDANEIQPLFDNYHRKIAAINLRFKRYLVKPAKALFRNSRESRV